MDFIVDALLDSLKILPFLLVCYVLIEVLEFFTANKIEHSKMLSNKWSTLFASSFGLIPQCGFSVVATDLFASKKIKIGTLMAVYIATSDEAVPILLTNPDKISALLPLLLIKFVLAVIVGYLVDLIFQKANKKRLEPNFKTNEQDFLISDENNEQNNFGDAEGKSQIELTSEHNIETENVLKTKNLDVKIDEVTTEIPSERPLTEHLHDEHKELDEHHKHADNVEHHHGCCGHDIEGTTSKKDLWKRFLLHPLVHSLKIFSFILVVNLLMGGLITLIGEDRLVEFLQNSKGFAPLVAGLIGLIPNCASSVVITELYAIGGISFGACIAGLVVNAGIAFVVLFKENKNLKENFAILGGMLATGVAVGYIIQLIGF